MKGISVKQNEMKQERKQTKFGYEDLNVWNKAVTFAVNIIEMAESIVTGRRHYRLIEQIEASSTSISMNIAEGKGRKSKKEFIQYCYIARGSLYETMTLLEIFFKKRWLTQTKYASLKEESMEIVSMLKGLINSLNRS